MTSPLAPYPSPEHRDAELEALARGVGGELFEYGRSVEGRALLGVRVPSTGASKLRVACCANIHGVEFIGNRVAHALLERLGDAGGSRAGQLRQLAEVVVLPCLNPDGYARTWAQEGVGSVAALRRNANGVDLNRNFPLPKGATKSRMPGAGSDRPGAATYRGPSPASEPEVRALADLFEREDLTASVNLHAFMGTLIPARTSDRADFQSYRELCRRAAAAQSYWPYRRVSNRVFDVFTGEQEDFQHHHHHTWAVCHEVFPVRASFAQSLRPDRTFWRFNPKDPQVWIDNDVPAVVAFLEGALAQLRRPASTE